MALILNLETATRNCSVALALDGVMLSLHEIAGEGFLHAEKLHSFIGRSIADAGYAVKDIDAVAVSMGPGSYTGLRIGVSAAKGLCYALAVPLIAVDTLESLARRFTVKPGEFIAPLIDARRMEVYTALFDCNYSKQNNTVAEVITADTFSNVEGNIHMIGDGALKCREVLSDSRFIYDDDSLFPSALQMCGTSYNKMKIGDTVDVAYFEPFYLKDFIAIKKL